METAYMSLGSICGAIEDKIRIHIISVLEKRP